MFTGLIRDLGTIVKIDNNETGSKLFISNKEVVARTKIGDSVSIDGICLTSCEKTLDFIAFDLVSETLDRTTARSWKAGDSVHLESAMTLSDRLDGHMVSGHVDTVVTLQTIQKKEESLKYSFELPSKYAGLIIEKGSVTLNGVSLTVAEVDQENAQFSVWLIPTTIAKTNLANLKVGSKVNLEIDLIAKYVVENVKRYLK